MSAFGTVLSRNEFSSLTLWMAQIVKRLILVLAGSKRKGRLVPSKKFLGCCKSDVWQCHVVIAQTISQSCGGSTNSQSWLIIQQKICHYKTSPDFTRLQDSCLEQFNLEQFKEVILGVCTTLHRWVVWNSLGLLQYVNNVPVHLSEQWQCVHHMTCM